jgi:hypothetical protein
LTALAARALDSDHVRVVVVTGSTFEILGFFFFPATGLLGEARGGVWRVFSRAGINVEHKKRVYLGVLGGADHNGRVRKAPFSTVDGLCVSRVSSSR